MIENYLQLLNEADEQIETAQKVELRKKFADAVKAKKGEVDQDFIANLSKELEIPQEEAEKMLVDFAINYSSIIAPLDVSTLDEEQLAKGIAHEKSHHDIPDEVAERIAAENLLSDPAYYTEEAPAKEELTSTEESPKEESDDAKSKDQKDDGGEKKEKTVEEKTDSSEKSAEEKKSC